MKNKKDSTWPGYRLPADTAEKGKAAYAKLKIDSTEFRRQFLEDVIRIAEAGDRPAVPARILTETEMRLPMLIDIPDLSAQILEAAERTGIDIPMIRRQLALDFVRLVKEGDRPSIPAHILTEKERELLERVKNEKDKEKKSREDRRSEDKL